ncbi:TetR/AcrR family transcriptional regulator [Microbacterium sp. BWT-B31]|uniref:TetR/AcrR family transcriptional regulator n=1 Tax=Microbacterium sp. BWT-B31 TaxID=3232072 RepID=UPI003528DA54
MQSPPGDTRSRLLQAASDLLADGGPEAVTLRAVGAAAGLSRGAAYRHFGDKDGLLSAIAAENLELIGRRMQRGAASRTGGRTPLCGALLGYVEGAMARPAHYRLVFGDFQIGNPSKALEDAATACTEYLYELIRDGQREGTIISGDIREITALMWAAVHGLVDLTLAGHLREPRTIDGARTTPRLVELAIDAIAPRHDGVSPGTTSLS